MFARAAEIGSGRRPDPVPQRHPLPDGELRRAWTSSSSTTWAARSAVRQRRRHVPVPGAHGPRRRRVQGTAQVVERAGVYVFMNPQGPPWTLYVVYDGLHGRAVVLPAAGVRRPVRLSDHNTADNPGTCFDGNSSAGHGTGHNRPTVEFLNSRGSSDPGSFSFPPISKSAIGNRTSEIGPGF